MMSKRGERCSFLLSAAMLVSGGVVTPVMASPIATVNVKDYGAVGDGTTDDTAAIRQAIQIAESKHAEVIFPTGSYLYSAQLLANGVHLRGYGHAELISTNKARIALSGWNPGVIDLTLKSQGAGATAIYCFNATKVVIRSNVFDVGFGQDIMLTTTDDSFISFNTFNVSKDGRGIYAAHSPTIAISNNQFRSDDASNSAGLLADDAKSVFISKNEFANFKYGVSITNSPSSKINDNSYQQCRVGLSITSSDGSECSRNKFYDSSEVGLFAGGSSNMYIAFNAFIGTLGESIRAEKDKGCTLRMTGINGGKVGISLYNCISIMIDKTTITNQSDAGLRVIDSSRITMQNGSIVHIGNVGIFVNHTNNMIILWTFIHRIDQQGILEVFCTGDVEITGNQLVDCGLNCPSESCVVFVQCPSATSIPITKNNYMGNTNNLKYFIRSGQPQPPTLLFGNTTDTLLPSKTGPDS